MIPVIKRNVLKPQHYDRFSCAIGGCEDNCCKGWSIAIDKKTYTKYKNVKNAAFREKVNKSIKRIRGENANNIRYAEFILDNEKLCPFQTPEKLCEIHRDLGEDYLCTTCRTYPRVAKGMSPDYLEMSVKMSCPEAVRIALFEEEPMEFTAETVGFKDNDPLLKVASQPVDRKNTGYLRYGWAMREAAITIMQKRNCPVAYRIIIIASMLNDIIEAHEAGKNDEIYDMLDFYSNGTYGQQFLDGFKNIEENNQIRIKMSVILYYAIKGRAESSPDSAFAELIERYGQHEEPADADIFSEQMLRNIDVLRFYAFTEQPVKKLWDGFMDKWGHVLENYLVSFMFTELFPLTFLEKGLDPYCHAFILAEQYAVLRILLCGNYDENEGFSKRYIVRAITHAAVVNQHSTNPLKVAENYKKAGISTPAHLYYLLL